jgi:hypothetical protein
MSHVKISTGKDVRGVARIEVDGVDISDIVSTAGFAVELPLEPHGVTTVRMGLVPSRLDLDLPDAVLALLEEQDQ